MWEFRLLKMPYVPHPTPEKHPIPILGSYIKYCQNLLDINNRYSLRRWFTWGAIKPYGGKEPYGAEAVQEKYEGMPRDVAQSLHGYSSHLKSDGLRHMQKYYKHRKDKYDKKDEVVANRANMLFLGLIQYLEQKVKEHQQMEREPKDISPYNAVTGGLLEQRRAGIKGAGSDSNLRAFEWLEEQLKDLNQLEGEMLWRKTQHGIRISLRPQWLVEEEYDNTWYETNVNLSQNWHNLCWREMRYEEGKTKEWDENREIGFGGRIVREICTGDLKSQPKFDDGSQEAFGDTIVSQINLVMLTPKEYLLQSSSAPGAGYFGGSRGISSVGQRKDFNIDRNHPESIEIYRDMHHEVIDTLKELHTIDARLDEYPLVTEQGETIGWGKNLDRYVQDDTYVDKVINEAQEFEKEISTGNSNAIFNLLQRLDSQEFEEVWEEERKKKKLSVKELHQLLVRMTQWLGELQVQHLRRQYSNHKERIINAFNDLRRTLRRKVREENVVRGNSHSPAINRFQRIEQQVFIIMGKLDNINTELAKLKQQEAEAHVDFEGASIRDDTPKFPKMMLNKTDGWFDTLKEGGTIMSGKAGVTNMAYGKGAQKPKKLKKPKVKKPKEEEEYLIIPDDPDFWRD